MIDKFNFEEVRPNPPAACGEFFAMPRTTILHREAKPKLNNTRDSARHRSKEFISFLNLIDNRMQSRKNKENIHIILDNSSTHKTKEVKEWLKAHPNYHFHFTPTSSSWLNAVENWFSRLEVKGLQRKAFQSVKQLREHLRQFIVTYNKHSAKPFV